MTQDQRDLPAAPEAESDAGPRPDSVTSAVVLGIQLTQGKGRAVLVAGAALELPICVAYLGIFLLIPTFGLAPVVGVQAVLVMIALFFAVLPTISIIQARSGTTTAWLGSRRAP